MASPSPARALVAKASPARPREAQGLRLPLLQGPSANELQETTKLA